MLLEGIDVENFKITFKKIIFYYRSGSFEVKITFLPIFLKTVMINGIHWAKYILLS